MYCRLVLVAGLLSYTGASSDQPGRVLAFVGGDVVLPCSFNISASSDFPTVEWSKEGLKPDVVFLYRDGCETYEMKNAAFEYRTSLVTKQLKKGNVSLRISNVQLSDAGRYQCMRLWANAPRDVTAVELVVGAVSEPELSLVPDQSEAATVECVASCWLPEPQISILDHQGNDVPAEKPKREREASGCYTVRQTVTVPRETSRVTCRAHLSEFNLTRDTELHLPAACVVSHALTTAIGVGVTASVLFAGIGLVVSLRNNCNKSGKQPVKRKESDQLSPTSESHLLLEGRSRAENEENNAVELLQRKVDDLESQLRVKEETICHLQSSPQICSVVCELHQPTVARSPSKRTVDVPKPLNHLFNHVSKTAKSSSDRCLQPTAPISRNPPESGHLPQSRRPTLLRQHSSPALLSQARPGSSSSPSGSAAETTSGRLDRSRSVSSDPPVRDMWLQRRHSSVLPVLAPPTHHYRVLGDFPEE